MTMDLRGIVLGEGNAIGEAYKAFQTYARNLARRGVILAVCSKNDESNAKLPFTSHPEMVLKLDDIACFVANWADKATNLRVIASSLNISLDSLVFVDDNPFERNIVRRELPMVMVPELPEDPSLYVRCVADAGYFELAQITEEDFTRSQQYQANLKRQEAMNAATDLKGYLTSLRMKLVYGFFDEVNLVRVTQLINKTNQFNLTTRRYSEDDIRRISATEDSITLSLRLIDEFGDNGIIAVVIAMPSERRGSLEIDTWLMSCRVLGRQIEQATLNILADQAIKSGAKTLVGKYLPTTKNGMVADHYKSRGFSLLQEAADGASTWMLDLSQFTPLTHAIEEIREG